MIKIVMLSLEPAADAVFAGCSQGDLLHCSISELTVSLLQLVICKCLGTFLCLSKCDDGLEPSGDSL